VRKCPKCGSPRIHRSRTKGFLEQLRKSFSAKRPHRCHACQWRGWGVETQHPVAPETPARSAKPGPNLEAIDGSVEIPLAPTTPVGSQEQRG
jgi:hypothetical protein